MCLACEMDAWWFAEMEARERAAAGAGAPQAPEEVPPAAIPTPSENAGGALVASGFVCEEIRSE